jgi:hypothetical protein
MQVKIEKLKGKVVTGQDKLKELYSGLEDGHYIVSIDKINPLVTTRDYQKAYFDKIDRCVECTGNSRYTIHDEFKKFCEIATTKDLGIIEWRSLLNKLSWWAYDKFDCIV